MNDEHETMNTEHFTKFNTEGYGPGHLAWRKRRNQKSEPEPILDLPSNESKVCIFRSTGPESDGVAQQVKEIWKFKESSEQYKQGFRFWTFCHFPARPLAHKIGTLARNLDEAGGILELDQKDLEIVKLLHGPLATEVSTESGESCERAIEAAGRENLKAYLERQEWIWRLGNEPHQTRGR